VSIPLSIQTGRCNCISNYFNLYDYRTVMLIAVTKEIITVKHNLCLLYILFWQHVSAQCGQFSYVYYWPKDDHFVATIQWCTIYTICV